MRVCFSCGATAQAEHACCTQCGAVLANVANRTLGGFDGGPSDAPPAIEPPAQVERPTAGRRRSSPLGNVTLLGAGPLAASAPPVPGTPHQPASEATGDVASAHQFSGHKTLLGIPPAHRVEPAERLQESASPESPTPTPEALPTPAPAPAEDYRAPESESDSIDKPPSPRRASPDTHDQEQTSESPPTVVLEDSLGPPSTTVPRRSSAATSGWLLLGTAGLMLGVLVGFAMFYHPAPPLVMNLQTSDQGEALSLQCADCADGTVASIGQAQATFHNQVATLPLDAELPVGKAVVELTIQPPNGESSQQQSLELPVHFRLKGDVSQLQAQEPRVGVLVAAGPNATAKVGKSPVKLTNGRGKYELALTTELRGPSPNAQRVIKRLPFEVTLPGRAPESGTIKLAFLVAPLVIQQPAAELLTNDMHFQLSGKTAPGGSIRVGSTPLAVNPDGTFSQRMSINDPGSAQLLVRADLPDHAPRIVQLRVSRTVDLEEEAQTNWANVSTALPDPYSQEHQGQRIALVGRLGEIRQERHEARAVLMLKGCTTGSCAVPLVHNGKLAFSSGQSVRVFGKLFRAQKGSSEEAAQLPPEVHTLFLLPASDP